MCFRWLKAIYHLLRCKRAHRNRGYSSEISLGHGRYCRGSFSNPHGHVSFTCGREGSVSYTRRPSYCPWPSYCPPVPRSPPYSISGGYTCDTDGSVAIGSGDGGGTSGWGVTVGTVPVYGTGGGGGYGMEGSGHAMGISEGEEGSVYPDGAPGGGAGYGYSDPPSDALMPGGVSEGAGGSSGGSGYALGGFSGPEHGPGGGGCSQVVQQKCPVVVPNIKTQQCKQSNLWPPSQKK
ncbi:PE-PGRS family protein PE_PGRS26-like [Pithys albifrons albifrons]|uniref:PE-PGRS family protein PE_PGRS26-like n=1 Tax=Pithys albifrons albifrons TaxID=3385563 RepID=UPI003A5D1734